VLDESLGSRLRQQRERRQISISTVAAKTKILGALLEGLERDDLSRWPSGLYRRSFVRAYAVAIGLDPEPIVREFTERFPDPAAPPPEPTGPVAPATPELPAPRASEALIPTAPDAPARSTESLPGLRLMLAETRTAFIGGRLLSLPRTRWAAAAFDAGVLVFIATAFWLTLGEFWLPLSVAIAFYYLGGILILGNSPGVCLFAPRPAETGGAPRWDDEAAEGVSGLWRSVLQRSAWASNPEGRRADR
jgi:transcriptional regulator with XRE-family HTH domain